MKLVLQCAMCGTHHPVGTEVCFTCRATGVANLRLMFECATCGRLGLNPACETCPSPVAAVLPLDLNENLIVAEEIPDEPFALDDEAEEEDDELHINFDDDEEDEDDEDDDSLTEFLDDDFDDIDEEDEDLDEFDDSDF